MSVSLSFFISLSSHFYLTSFLSLPLLMSTSFSVLRYFFLSSLSHLSFSFSSSQLLTLLLNSLSLHSSLFNSLLMRMSMFTRSVGSLPLCTHKSDFPRIAECVGLGPVIDWRITRITQKESVQVFLCKPRATWNEMALYLRWRWRCACGVLVVWRCCCVACGYTQRKNGSSCRLSAPV